MTWSALQALLAGIALVGFIAFAFRQGMKVKSPEDGGGSGDHGHYPPDTN